MHPNEQPQNLAALFDTHAAALERADCGSYVQTHNNASLPLPHNNASVLLHAAAAEMRASADALEAAHTELDELRQRYIAEVKAGNRARRLAAALAAHLRRRTAERDALRLDIATLEKRDRESAETLVHINVLRQQERDRAAALAIERDRLLALVVELRAVADASGEDIRATIDEAMGTAAPTLPMRVARAATGWEGDDHAPPR